MTSRINRQLPKSYSRNFIEAVRSEIGEYSFEMILRDANIAEEACQTSEFLKHNSLNAAEFSGVLAAVRSYYGSGARGTLNRIGRSVWHKVVRKTLKGWIVYPLVRLAGARLALRLLANLIKKPDGDVSVHLLDREMIFMDTSSDATVDQEDDQPVCWYTIGLIQACVSWASNEEISVEEIACRAMGHEACKFKIE